MRSFIMLFSALLFTFGCGSDAGTPAPPESAKGTAREASENTADSNSTLGQRLAECKVKLAICEITQKKKPQKPEYDYTLESVINERLDEYCACTKRMLSCSASYTQCYPIEREIEQGIDAAKDENRLSIARHRELWCLHYERSIKCIREVRDRNNDKGCAAAIGGGPTGICRKDFSILFE